jgi:DNA primase large subunit
VKSEISNELYAAFASVPGNKADLSIDIYRMPFNLALDLVKQRKVLLKKGFVYVAFYDVMDVVVSTFRGYLSRSLSVR